jgi:hypothetical protein
MITFGAWGDPFGCKMEPWIEDQLVMERGHMGSCDSNSDEDMVVLKMLVSGRL